MMRYKLEHRNLNFRHTSAWRSQNPFKANTPWFFDSIGDAKTRAAVLGHSTHARVVDTTTNEVIVTWRLNNGKVTVYRPGGKFNDEELACIAHAAQGVWQEIGCDVLDAIGKETGKGEGATVSKAAVVEMVMDCSRLEEALRRGKDTPAGLADRVAKDLYSGAKVCTIERFLKTTVFRGRRYGF